MNMKDDTDGERGWKGKRGEGKREDIEVKKGDAVERKEM